MKIVLVHGQNHKGSTYNISQLLVDNISCEKDIVEFFLPKDLNHFCLGCYSCIEDEKKCPYYEEKNSIMKKIESADLLIFTTPNYCMAPSAPMKAFMDLTFTYWLSHKPRKAMFHKKAIVISTTAGVGAMKAIKPIKRMLFYWGIPYIKHYGIAVQAKSWHEVSEKKKEKIKKDIIKIAKGFSKGKKANVPFKTKFMFNIMANMQKSNKGSSIEERQYWDEKGWLRKERPWK